MGYSPGLRFVCINHSTMVDANEVDVNELVELPAKEDSIQARREREGKTKRRQKESRDKHWRKIKS